MTRQTEDLSLTKLQGRKVETAGRFYPPVRAHSPSLNAARFDFAPLHFRARRLLLVILSLLFVILFSEASAVAQEVADTIRINTRVVFMDALVKDKKSGIPISDLTTENFEILDNGKPRTIAYFTREGQARKPLALVIILDLREDGAGRFLKRPEILKAMIDELSKLGPEDEVAIMAMDMGEDEKRCWLTGFTRDAGKIAEALQKVPNFIVDSAPAEVTRQEGERDKSSKQSETNTDANADMPKPLEAGLKDNEVVTTEVIKGKNGAVVTRTIRKDGSIDVKRVSKDGKITVELDDIYDMAGAVRDATRRAQQQRPNSQASIVWISDGIAPIFFEDRDATQELLIRNNVIFNSLTVELRTLFKLLLPLGKPVAGWIGVSLYGSAKRLAQQSGGEAVKVGRVKDYGTGLSKIIGNLTARYSLGFTFSEDEIDDGKLHNLEVRVKATDAKGKTRKLQVSSRQGYYMASAAPKEATASMNK
jgi:VWFA-related protein